jgi:hypothetical protein
MGVVKYQVPKSVSIDRLETLNIQDSDSQINWSTSDPDQKGLLPSPRLIPKWSVLMMMSLRMNPERLSSYCYFV